MGFGGLLAKADLDVLRHKDFWQGVHVAIVLLMVGLLGVFGRIDGTVCGTILTGMLTTVWGIKTALVWKDKKDAKQNVSGGFADGPDRQR